MTPVRFCSPLSPSWQWLIKICDTVSPSRGHIALDWKWAATAFFHQCLQSWLPLAALRPTFPHAYQWVLGALRPSKLYPPPASSSTLHDKLLCLILWVLLGLECAQLGPVQSYHFFWEFCSEHSHGPEPCCYCSCSWWCPVPPRLRWVPTVAAVWCHGNSSAWASKAAHYWLSVKPCSLIYLSLNYLICEKGIK